MATKKTPAVTTLDTEEPVTKAVEAVPAVVTLDLADAEKIMELFTNMESADAHFHTCQSDNFRMYLQGVYKAPNIRNAYDKLRNAIDALKGQ